MRIKILPAVSAAIVISGCASTARLPIRPEPIKKGDKIAIVGPSYYLPDSTVNKACEALRKRGYVPIVADNVSKKFPYAGKETGSFYAGAPDERAAGLVNAMEDESIKAIICSRGGYGAIQTLQKMDPELFRKNPKWIVGYSDATALHMASVKAGVMSIHGNMATTLASKGDEEEGNIAMLKTIEGEIPEYTLPANKHNTYGKATGMLIGGNFITMISVLGSKYDPIQNQDCILFLEEVEESMHAIDRLFNMLKVQGKMKHVKGIIFGDFTDCGNEFSYGSIEDMLSSITSNLGIPVAFGFPGGHGPLNLPLIEGSRITLEVNTNGTSIK